MRTVNGTIRRHVCITLSETSLSAYIPDLISVVPKHISAAISENIPSDTCACEYTDHPVHSLFTCAPNEDSNQPGHHRVNRRGSYQSSLPA